MFFDFGELVIDEGILLHHDSWHVSVVFLFSSIHSCLILTMTPFWPSMFIFIIFQPLARMGASVTGVDAVEKNIKIARLHAVCLICEGNREFN